MRSWMLAMRLRTTSNTARRRRPVGGHSPSAHGVAKRAVDQRGGLTAAHTIERVARTGDSDSDDPLELVADADAVSADVSGAPRIGTRSGRMLVHSVHR